jgi:GNAT superfamily N-acetyltransferase
MHPELLGSILVQRATYVRHEDVAVLRSLYAQLTPFEKDFSHERVNGLIKTCGGNLTLFLALDKERDARPVGMASLVEVNRLRETVGLVEDVVVDQEYRRKGIGRALMEKVIESATVRQYGRLDLTSNAKREAAQELYASLGFETHETNNWQLSLR